MKRGPTPTHAHSRHSLKKKHAHTLSHNIQVASKVFIKLEVAIVHEMTDLTESNMTKKLILKFTAKFESNSSSSFCTVYHLFTQTKQLILHHLSLTLKTNFKEQTNSYSQYTSKMIDYSSYHQLIVPVKNVRQPDFHPIPYLLCQCFNQGNSAELALWSPSQNCLETLGLSTPSSFK